MAQLTIPGLVHPLIQAPMAGISTPQLAAAVCNAGGLGSLGIAANTLDEAARMIVATRQQTSRPFNVNVFCHRPAQRDEAREAAWLSHLSPLFANFGAQPPRLLQEAYPSFVGDHAATAMLLALTPAVVSFHFGLPKPAQLAALRGAGIVTMATATSEAEAHAITDAGVDVVIAQGYEAGGHRGIFAPDDDDRRLPLASLLERLVRSCSVPVIAAGGVMDGRDMRRLIDAGAAAAQLGTAFVACPESAAGPAQRQALATAGVGATVMTSAISGRPARGLANVLTRHGSARGAPRPADYPLAYDAAKQLNAIAVSRGDNGYGAWWAGEGAHRTRAMPAGDLVQTLVGEMRA